MISPLLENAMLTCRVYYQDEPAEEIRIVATSDGTVVIEGPRWRGFGKRTADGGYIGMAELLDAPGIAFHRMRWSDSCHGYRFIGAAFYSRDHCDEIQWRPTT